MNTNILKGDWKKLKGEAKERWGALTNDDLDRIEGNVERLEGALQKRYGYAQDQARKEVQEFCRANEA